VAQASADEYGRAAASAEGMYICGGCTFDLSAGAFYETSYTNNTSGTVSFSYDFFVTGPVVEVIDYYGVDGVDQTSGLGAVASTDVMMTTTGGSSDSANVSAALFGGRLDHDFFSTDSNATYYSIEDGYGFGYRLDDFNGTFSGVLAAGETVTITADLLTTVFGPGWELGAMASIGDPNDLSTGSFISGQFNISAVPVPAAAWLFVSGLIGLIGITRRN